MAFDDWLGMLAAFRAQGGVFDNLIAREESGQRGLYPIDPTQDCRLHVPKPLLVPADDVRLVDGKLKVAPESTVAPEAKEFFEAYHEVTSWADGGSASVEKSLRELHQLPSPTKRMLSEDFGLAGWFAPITEQAVLLNFIRARRVALDGETYLAPVLELSNHDPQGPKIASDDTGLTLGGTFNRQFAWRYRTADTFQMFRAYRFASPERFTFSLPFDVFDKRLQKNIRIAIDTATREPRDAPAPVPVPVVKQSEHAIDITFVLLGDKTDPRNGRRSFRQDLWPQLGVNEMEFFEGLLFYNRQRFLQLLATLEDDASPAAPLVRKVCRLQLEGLNMVSYQ